MTEKDMEELLSTALHADESGTVQEKVRSWRTFEERGVLTMNKGLVIRCKDGSEFQITIVRSR